MSKSRWDAICINFGLAILQGLVVWSTYLIFELVFDLGELQLPAHVLDASTPFLVFFGLFLVIAYVGFIDSQDDDVPKKGG